MSLFRRLLLITLTFFINSQTRAQCPPNIGFEDGSFNHWQTQSGSINPQGNILMGGSIPGLNRHRIFSDKSTEMDPFGDFPVISPNGSKYSVRLGNSEPGGQAERLSYTYSIPPGKSLTLILNYAVVLENPDHLYFEQPRFTAKAYNVTDDKPIDCPSFDFIASSGPGFKKSKESPNVLFKDWSATAINLEGYGGKTIRLDFTTNDCSRGGHFGYAYLDIDEMCTEPISGNIYCKDQTEVTLRSPTGFETYEWYNGTMPYGNPVGTDQNLVLNSPPNNAAYTLVVRPFFSTGCPSIFYTTIQRLDSDFKLTVRDTVTACLGTPVDLTDPLIIAGSTPGTVTSYYLDKFATSLLPSPKSVVEAGTYYIMGISPEGCIAVKPVVVDFIKLPQIAPISVKTAQYPATVDITMPDASNMVYNYFKDGACKIPLNNYRDIASSGTYFVRATSTITGCQSFPEPAKVVITAPPPFVLNIPNTFTPNSDGVNDVLKVDITGYLSFGSLKFYNRYGTLLYTAKQQNDSWTGTQNGQPLPVGTYYWIFEGTDMYYKTPVRIGGSVALIR